MIETYLFSAYRDGGRGERQHGITYYDCWGLVRAVRHDVFGLALMANHDDVRAANKRAMTKVARQEIRWLREGMAQDAAIAAVWTRGLCTHVGICISLDGVLGVLETNEGYGAAWHRLAWFERLHGNTRYYL